MTNPNLTLVTVVLDRSGSMMPLREATVSGLNEFLNKQREVPGEVLVHLVQFDDQYQVVRDMVNLKEVKEITQADYEPRGWTALYDAVGKTINDVGAKLASMPEATRPGKVVVVIQTDGQENYSKEYTQPQIMEMVTHQREQYSWDFVFLGANIDAFAVGGSLGILRSNTLQYTADIANTKALYSIASSSINSYRTGATVSASFDANQRQAVVSDSTKSDSNK